MEASLILETSFLIDLERELAQVRRGPAQELLDRNRQARLYLTFTIAGELAAGPAVDERQKWSDFLAPFHILPDTLDVSWEYGRTFRYLQANGLLIGANDLWIAAAGLAYGMPVVTRNERHFKRVPELRVIPYAEVVSATGGARARRPRKRTR